jgi:hypothetical protein
LKIAIKPEHVLDEAQAAAEEPLGHFTPDLQVLPTPSESKIHCLLDEGSSYCLIPVEERSTEVRKGQ